jgi:predicted transposase YbfD/YdcC
MVSAWSASNRLVLGQEVTEEKSNEITAIPRLLALLELKGCIVSIDAMGCQRDIAKQIVDQGGDYVLGLKGNQGTLHEAVEDYFTTAQAAGFKQLK